MKKNNRKKGISLMVLLVSIVVLILIAAITILSLKDTDYLENTDEMEFKSELSEYNEQIKNAVLNEYNNDKDIFKKTINTKSELARFSEELSKSKYADISCIKEGNFTLNETKITVQQKDWAQEIGIKVEAY